MDVFDLGAKISLDSSQYDKGLASAESKGSSFASKLGKGLTAAAAVGTAAVGAVSTAIGALTTLSVKSYAEYEQLAGGVETLFKKSSDKVMEYADNAYKTAGMSANEYMSTVTSFSASLLQGLGGDTNKAAEYANTAITDMSDNANKMGTSMESIQNAYQGFAKQNYTMLDNLKLGYGGTASEMARLVKDSGVLGKEGDKLTAKNLNQKVSFDKMIEAIHKVQDNMGITGTTAKEAATTIEGSINSMKAAWQNLLVGFSDKNADVSGLVKTLLSSAKTVFDNIKPVAQQALKGIEEFINQMAPAIGKELPAMLNDLIPSMIKMGSDLFNALMSGLITNLPKFASTIGTIVNNLVGGFSENAPKFLQAMSQIIQSMINAIITNLPKFLDSAAQMINNMAVGIQQNLPKILTLIINIASQLIQTLINNLPKFISAGIDLINSLISGIIQALPLLLEKIPLIISSLMNALSESLPQLITIGLNLLQMLVDGILQALPLLIEQVPVIIDGIMNALVSQLPQIISVGLDLITKLFDGILQALPVLIDQLPTIINGIINVLLAALPQIIQTGVQLLTALTENLPVILDHLINSIDSIISNLIDALIDNLPAIAEAGIDLFMALIKNLPKILIAIGGAVAKLVAKIWITLASKAPQMAKKGFEFIMSLFSKLPEMLTDIGKSIGDIIQSIVDAFASNPLVEVGQNLIKGLWQGINDMKDWIIGLITGFANGVVDKIKDIFGIHSPSKVFAEIGSFLAQGLGVGWEDAIPDVQKSIEDDLNFSVGKLSTDIEANVSAKPVGTTYDLNDIYDSMNKILNQLQVNGANTVSAIENSDTSIVLNDREFGRAVRKVYA